MTLEFGVSTSILGDRQLQVDDLEAFAGAGIRLIELVGTGLSVDYGPLDTRYLADIRDSLYQNGIQVHSFHFSCGVLSAYGDPASLDETLRLRAVESVRRDLEHSRFFSAHYLVVHPEIVGFSEWDQKQEHMRACRRSLEEMAVACEAEGIRMAVEILAPKGPRVGIYYQDILTLIEGLNPDVVGICLDTNHANLSNDLVEIIHAFGPRLFTTHISDNEGEKEQHLMPFDGVIDWPAVMGALRAVEYSGALMYELKQADSLADRLRETVENYGRLRSGLNP